VTTPARPLLVESEATGTGTGTGTGDLLTWARGVAELIEDDGRYEVTAIGEERELPAVWLRDDPDTAEARRRLLGCVSVHADPPEDRFQHFLLVLLAEAEDERHAELIADSAWKTSDRLSFPRSLDT